MLILNTEQAAADLAAAERIDVFAIDTTTYSIPKEMDGGALLRYLDDCAEIGESAAMAHLIRELLGEAAYEALIGFEGIKPAQIKELFDLIEEHAMGQMDKIGGKSRGRSSGRPRGR